MQQSVESGYETSRLVRCSSIYDNFNFDESDVFIKEETEENDEDDEDDVSSDFQEKLHIEDETEISTLENDILGMNIKCVYFLTQNWRVYAQYFHFNRFLFYIRIRINKDSFWFCRSVDFFDEEDDRICGKNKEESKRVARGMNETVGHMKIL